MAAMLDLLKNNPNFGSQGFVSKGLFSCGFVSASSSVSAISFPISTAFACRALFRDGTKPVSYCKRYDMGADMSTIFPAASGRSAAQVENEEDEGATVYTFKEITKRIVQEAVVYAITYVVEELAGAYLPPRIAGKLLKDLPESAMRKAGRKLAFLTFCFKVSRATFRGYLLGALVSWLVQGVMDIYEVSSLSPPIELAEKLRMFRNRLFVNSVERGGELFLAAVGGAIGAALIRPSTGQWIGSAVGEFVGPFLVTFALERLICCGLKL